jgi:hypothetical protein
VAEEERKRLEPEVKEERKGYRGQEEKRMRERDRKGKGDRER